MSKTQCSPQQLEFQGLGRRRVEARFDGGRVTSDGGILLTRELAERSGILRRFSECFVDHRDPRLVEHSVHELVGQRVLGLIQGYEDLNDHDDLRDDALLATAVGKPDPVGATRRRQRDQGHALAGKSTLNRLELTPEDADRSHRYKKIVYRADAIDRLMVDVFLDAHEQPPTSIVVDLDATDDPLHGRQEGRFFHGYYRHYCYLPLYMTCGDFLLTARLRPSNIDASKGSVEELERVVSQIRERWPDVEIIVRADSGFAREAIMAWCESNDVEFVLGLAKNARLEKHIADEMEQVRQQEAETGQAARMFKQFEYRTRNSWSRSRRVVAKAEQLPGKANPRFVVTSLPCRRMEPRALYERLYCARGDMENRIKEQQLGLFADRTSCNPMRANQLRLYFSSMAYVLLNEVRRVGLKGTKLERAQVGTIRTRLLKIGAVVKVSVRRVYASMSSVFPLKEVFERALSNIQRCYPLRV